MENLFSSPELRASLGRLFVSYANSTWEGSRAAGTKGKEMPVLPWLGSWRRACWDLVLGNWREPRRVMLRGAVCRGNDLEGSWLGDDSRVMRDGDVLQEGRGWSSVGLWVRNFSLGRLGSGNLEGQSLCSFVEQQVVQNKISIRQTQLCKNYTMKSGRVKSNLQMGKYYQNCRDV